MNSTCCNFSKAANFPWTSCARHNLSSLMMEFHQKHECTLHSLKDFFHIMILQTTWISKMTVDPLRLGLDNTWLLNLPRRQFFLHEILSRHQFFDLSSLDLIAIPCWWAFLGISQYSQTQHEFCLIYFGGTLRVRECIDFSLMLTHLIILHNHLLTDCQ